MNKSVKKLFILFIGLGIVLCFNGCSKPSSVLVPFIPQAIGSEQVVEGEGPFKYISYKSDEYHASARLVEKVGIYGLILRIENKTDSIVGTAEYSVGIYDGRDHKPLAILDREKVIEYRNKIASGGSIKTGNSMVDYSVGQISGLFQSMTRSEASVYLSYIDWAINHYFTHRPIYNHEAREGVLVAGSNFMLEYPISVVIKIKERNIEFRFLPPVKKKE